MFILAAVPSKGLPPILGNAGEVIFIYGFIMAENDGQGSRGWLGNLSSADAGLIIPTAQCSFNPFFYMMVNMCCISLMNNHFFWY